MVITFSNRGNSPISFSDFCSRILWAVKPKIEKDMMLHGIDYVRDNYVDYQRLLSIVKNLDRFEYDNEYHEWTYEEIVVNDDTIDEIMKYQGKSLVDGLCNGFENETSVCYPISVESVSDNHISIFLQMTDVPLTWLALIAKIYDVEIEVIETDDLSDNPFIYIDSYHIFKRNNTEDVTIIAYDEVRHSIARRTVNKEKSGDYSFENLPDSCLEVPASTVPAMVYNNDSQLCHYDPITEFREKGGSDRRPTVETHIDRVLPYSLRDAFRNVLKRFDKESETGKLLNNEINTLVRKGWDDYIVFLSNLIPQIKDKCISLKGSAMNSLLLQHSTQYAPADMAESSIPDINGPLVLECNLVGLSDVIDELKKYVSDEIEFLARYYWYDIYQTSENEFIISEKGINSREKAAFSSGKADRSKYLTVRVNSYIGI